MEAMKVPEGYVTKQEFFARLESAGESIPETRIDDWCEKRLLQRRQSGLGIETGGSVGLYPEIAVQQALEIERLFKVKKRADFVGWQLWWQGYDVHEKYWRPEFEHEYKLVNRVLPGLIRQYIKYIDNDFNNGNIIDKIMPVKLPPIIRRRARNLKLSDYSTSLSILMNAVTGRETEFYVDPVSGEETGYDRRATAALLGLNQAEKDHVAGVRLSAQPALDNALRALSAIPFAFTQNRQFFSGTSLAALKAARDDVRNALETAAMMRRALMPIYGRQAFGLSLAAEIAEHGSPASLAVIIIAWKEVREREHGDAFLSSREIADMRREAAEVLAQSRQLQQAIEFDPALASILTKKRLKEAFSKPEKMQSLCREIARIK
jgi:hypothetical protein